MKNTLKPYLTCLVLLFCGIANAQGLIANSSIEDISLTTTYPHCGSFELMKNADSAEEGLIELSDGLMEQLSHLIANQKENRDYEDLLIIPIVFHVVYNSEDENIPDSVLMNQLTILNECFRRKNADTTETRPAFLDLVGDTKIEFKLAELDPAGLPTTGITRTNTAIEHFGGILPYGPGETEAITTWVNDSLFYNYFRLTNTSLGGEDAWDTEKYLNIWMGDLRIFEPAFSDFEEIVYFALATPPLDHINWPDSVLATLDMYSQGVLIHYVNVGSNNPNLLPAPYGAYNALVRSGKIMVHEVGHYLGLRHIWGDGDCSFDDFIPDTPNSNSSSNWTCNYFINSCTDDIFGVDLPNMVENYMDYSSGDCQNSFTIDQANIMRAVLSDYRPFLAETISTATIGNEQNKTLFSVYPNPTNTNLNVDLGTYYTSVQISILNYMGQVIIIDSFENTNLIALDLNVAPGIYFIKLNADGTNEQITKFIVE